MLNWATQTAMAARAALIRDATMKKSNTANLIGQLLADIIDMIFGLTGRYGFKAYGAVGNGIADDSAAIAECIAACIADGVSVAYGTPGTFLCGNVLVPAGFRLELDANCIMKVPDGASYCVRLDGDNSHVIGGKFDGNGTLLAGQQVIPIQVNGSRCTVIGTHVYDAPWDAVGAFDASNDCLFERIWVYKVNSSLAAGRVGINASLSGRTYRNTIRDCWVRDTNDWGVGGLSATTDLLVEGCHCYDTGGDCVTGYAATNVRMTVRNCVGINNANHGTHLGGADPTVEGCVFINSGNDGILIQSDPNAQPTYSNGCIVSANRIVGAKNNGIEVASYSRALIADNNVELDGTNAAHGYLLEDLETITLEGNIATGSANRGYNLLGIGKGVISGNIARANATHGCRIQSYTRPVVGTVIASGDLLIAGNAFIDNLGGWGILSDTVSNVTVVHNNLSGNSAGSVSLTGTGNVIGPNRGWTMAIQEFTANGTWLNNFGASKVVVDVQGSGGGGGGGARVTSGTSGSGGAGGGAGCRHTRDYVGSELTATVAITIGLGGNAGIGASADNTPGSPGGVGGLTSFGPYINAHGGGGGQGGAVNDNSGGGGSAGFNGAGLTGAAGTGGNGGPCGGVNGGSGISGGACSDWGPGGGGGGGNSGGAGGVGNIAAHGPPGGCAGGGITAGGLAIAGTTALVPLGSNASQALGGTVGGGNGGNATNGCQVAGGAGGSGGANSAGNGGAAGTSVRGAGGSGGGAAIGGNGGVGAPGGNGFIRVTSFYL